jgi:cytochrome c553
MQVSRVGTILLTLTVAMIAGVTVLAPTVAQGAEVGVGQEAFVANKCNMCHSIESLGIERTSTSDKMKASDLSTVGDTVDAEWVVGFLKKELEREGELHKRTFKGTDEQMQAIAEWLPTLKSAE